MKNLRVPQVEDSILCPTPTMDQLDGIWFDYVRACHQLSDMRHKNSKTTIDEIEKQSRLTEKLLQDWINGTNKFKAHLN